jgi:hypothetical protein
MERSRCTPYSKRPASSCRHLTSRGDDDLSRDRHLASGDYEANETIRGGGKGTTSLGSVRPQPSGGSCRSFSMNNKQPEGQDGGTIEREKEARVEYETLSPSVPLQHGKPVSTRQHKKRKIDRDPQDRRRRSKTRIEIGSSSRIEA